MSSLGWHCITKVDAHTVMSFGRLAKIKVSITFWYMQAISKLSNGMQMVSIDSIYGLEFLCF
jgi:hypothetical protein